MSHVGEDYERPDKDTKEDTNEEEKKEDKEQDKERYGGDPEDVFESTAGSSSSVVSRRSSTDSTAESPCRERCPECEKLFRLVGRPPPRPDMDRLSLGSQNLSGLLVEVEFGVKELAAILPRAERRFPGRFQDAASLRVTTGEPETVVEKEENANNASDSCELEADDVRRVESIRQKIARLNTELEAKNLEILRKASCVPELRFYCRDLVRLLGFCHVQIARYGLMTDPAFSWIVNRCGGGGGGGGPVLPPSPLFYDRGGAGYGLDALNFYRQRLAVLHVRFRRRQEERGRRHEDVELRFARDSEEARRRFIWRLEEYFSSPPNYRPPLPPSSNQQSCSELSNV